MPDEYVTVEAENALLREFFQAWCFFHTTCNVKSDMGPDWEETRRKMAAQALTESAQKVAAHYK